jgi:hypothetical protein
MSAERPLLPTVISTQVTFRVTRLGKLLPIGRLVYSASFLLHKFVDYILTFFHSRSYVCMYAWMYQFRQKMVGLHFGHFFHELIGSPCTWAGHKNRTPQKGPMPIIEWQPKGLLHFPFGVISLSLLGPGSDVKNDTVCFAIFLALRFFPNPKLQNAKFFTVTLPNFKSLNVRIYEWPTFRSVKLSNI